MTTVSEESQKLGLSYSLITVFFLFYVFMRKCCCKRREYNDYEDVENNYKHMEVKQRKPVYLMYFSMMYVMTLVNYLSAIIYLVANKK